MTLTPERIAQAREQAREKVHTAMSEHHAYHCTPTERLPSHAIKNCPAIMPALDLYRDLERAHAVAALFEDLLCGEGYSLDVNDECLTDEFAKEDDYRCGRCEAKVSAQAELERLVTVVEG